MSYRADVLQFLKQKIEREYVKTPRKSQNLLNKTFTTIEAWPTDRRTIQCID